MSEKQEDIQTALNHWEDYFELIFKSALMHSSLTSLNGPERTESSEQ